MPENVLELVEDALLVQGGQVDGEDLLADARGTEQLLEYRVHVACGTSIL